jgi:hypothetical protein
LLNCEQAKTSEDSISCIVSDRSDSQCYRICNQAFFNKIYLTEIDTAHAEPGEPVNILFNKDVQQEALAWQHERNRAMPPSLKQQVNVLNIDPRVGDTGFEPVTSSVSGKQLP